MKNNAVNLTGRNAHRVTIGLVTVLVAGSTADAQCTAWLPHSDVPAKTTPLPSAMPFKVFSFDEDGPGPKQDSVFVFGSLGTLLPGSESRFVAFDGLDWRGVGTWNNGRGDSLVFDPDDEGPQPGMLLAGMRGFGASPPTNPSFVWGVGRLVGSEWVQFGQRLDLHSNGTNRGAEVRALAAFDPDGPGPIPKRVVAGGMFELAGNVRVGNIAMWTGSEWDSMGGGFPFNSGSLYISTMLPYDPDGAGPSPTLLIVGGNFLTPFTHLAAWNGSNWLAFGQPNLKVDALTLFDHDGSASTPRRLVASGSFNTIGGIPAQRIAMHDGSTWRTIGAVQAPYISSLAVCDFDGPGPEPESLFATANATIIRWTGTTWATVPLPPNRFVEHITTVQNPPHANSPQLFATALHTVDSLVPGIVLRYARSDAPPQILTQPDPVVLRSIQSGEVRVAASGDDLTFRWFRNGIPVQDGIVDQGVLSGAFSPSLRFITPSQLHSGSYVVEVGNACGLVRSRAVQVTIICTSDFDANQSVDFFDYLDFLAAFSAQDPAADLDNNGQVDFTDYLTFLDAFNRGC